MPVNDGQRFVDCAYCRTRHEVVIPESATAELSAKVEDLKLREELRNLDASWKRYIEKVSVKLPSGGLEPPSANVVVENAMVCFVVSAFGALVLAQVSTLALIVAIPAGVLISWHIISGALLRKRAFESTKLMHENTRRKLVRRIERNGEASFR